MDTKWSVRGKYIVITGVTSGIGLAAVKEFASLGANLGIIARNQAKANEVAAQIKASTSANITVDVFLADMSSQQSIRKVAADILANCPRVDMLINNAGAMFERRQLTIDGIEMTWAVNHLAPFLLTTLLLDRLKESGNARIITTVSDNHMMAKKGINFDDLSAKHLYSFPKRLMGGPTYRYGETKLASILFTVELARRLEGSKVTAYCFHPGLVATNFNKNNGIAARLTMSIMKMFSISPEKGAETLIWLANTGEIPGHNGNYYTNMKLGVPSVLAQDMESAKRLWEVSEKQTQITNK